MMWTINSWRALSNLSSQFTAHPMQTAEPQSNPTPRQIADFFSVTTAAVSKWKVDGKDLSSFRAVAGWLKSHKQLSEATKQACTRALVGNAITVDGGQKPKTPIPTGGVQGAAAALRRQEEMELDLWNRLQHAMEHDPGQAKDLRDAWVKVGETLRKFDLMVEASRRDSGELISRAEWERMSRALVFWWIHAFRRASDDLCPHLVGLADAAAAWKVLDAGFVDKFGEAFEFACKRESAISLPKWAVDAIESALDGPTMPIPVRDGQGKVIGEITAIQVSDALPAEIPPSAPDS